MINNSFLNILFFIITTILYFVAIRPKLTVEVMMNPDAQVKYEKQKLVSLGIYFLLAVLVQFVINVSVIRSACGGNLSQNIGTSALITFLNWVLIFGVMMVILVAFPGFKSAFSDVVGYFYVSKKANELLTDLLIDPKISGKIDTATQGNPDKKRELEAAADTIIKICGNTSILINQMIPTNFMEYWGILQPLMKDRYQGNMEASQKIRDQLFDLVVTKDLIGEAMWYVYTGILMVCIVQYKVALNGCKANSATMEANYKKFQEEEQAKQSEQSQVEDNQQVYTITQ
jgi:hypothetical protein